MIKIGVSPLRPLNSEYKNIKINKGFFLFLKYIITGSDFMFTLGLIILFFLIHLLKEFFPEKLKVNFYFFGIFVLTIFLFFQKIKTFILFPYLCFF